MSTIADYVDRQVDVLAFASQPSTVVLSQSLFGLNSNGLLVTGIDKLAQRWCLEFLTVLGSMPFLADRGTTFVAAARAGRLRNEGAVFIEFRFAVEQIRQNLTAEDTADTPDDERFARATLDQILLTDDGQLGLSVTILSVAGTSRSVILPIAVSTLATPDFG